MKKVKKRKAHNLISVSSEILLEASLPSSGLFLCASPHPEVAVLGRNESRKFKQKDFIWHSLAPVHRYSRLSVASSILHLIIHVLLKGVKGLRKPICYCSA